MLYKSPYKYKSLVMISNFFQPEIQLYCEKCLRTHLDHVSELEGKKMFAICFSRDYGISDPLFIHLWTLFTAFILMQVKAGLDTPMFNYILPVLYKDVMISIIYQIYRKSFIELITLPAHYAMRVP